MPIYQYMCSACDHQFEKFVRKMDGQETTTCPECGKEAVRTVALPSPFTWGRGGPYLG